jgi:transposase
MSTTSVDAALPSPNTEEPLAFTQVRAGVQALLADGKMEEAVDYSLAALGGVLKKMTELELLLAKLRRQQAGVRSERISPEQLALLLEQMQQLEPAVREKNTSETEAREDAALDQQLEQLERAARAGRARRARPRRASWQGRAIAREVHEVDVPARERICGGCGREKRRIGDDITRTLEYVPAHFTEHEYRLAKYACGTCKDGVSRAAGPRKVIERSSADASVLAHVVVSKFADHMPLHRQRRSYDRSGVRIPVSTLSDWVAVVADRILPLVDVLAARVLRAYLVRTDATGLKVLEPRAAENIERGTLWCYVGDDRDVIFRYTPTGEGATGPWQFLAGRRGYIQADAAGVFDRLYNGQQATAVEVGCWAHARRRFVALAETDCRAAYPLQLIRRLYRLEYLADLQELEPDERAALRNERTRAALNKLQHWLLVTLLDEPPSSDMAKAANYCLNHWTALTRFLDDGRLSPDNNLCEQQLRDVALGRKNYLFAGSHDAARRMAALYSLMRTCAQHEVPPLAYLTDVLRKIANGWEQNRLEELLPDRWQLLHRERTSQSLTFDSQEAIPTTV